jgi:uncharacterized membrane protein YraQ (UPF0718 family)
VTEILSIAAFVGRALWRVLPAFLLSVALGVLIRALALDGMIRRAVEAREGLAVALATAIGAFSPLCSCTVVPVVSGLLLSGVPLGPVMAFWVASPTMDPEMFALTVATLGWSLAATRLAAALVLSLAAGYLTLALTRAGFLTGGILRQPAPAPLAVLAARPSGGRPGLPIAGASDAAGSSGCCAPSCCTRAEGARAGEGRGGSAWRSHVSSRLATLQWAAFGRDLARESSRLGRWLVLAFILEALMERYLPQAAVAGVLGHANPVAPVLAALVGIPLYLNNVSALPIVAGLLNQGMQPGAAIAFLIAGPVTTVPAMAAVWGVVRPRVFALYLGIALVGAVALGYLATAALG